MSAVAARLMGDDRFYFTIPREGLPRYRRYYQHRAHRGIVIAPAGRRSGHRRSRVVDDSRLQHARNRSRALTCSPTLVVASTRPLVDNRPKKPIVVHRIIFQNRTKIYLSLVFRYFVTTSRLQVLYYHYLG